MLKDVARGSIHLKIKIWLHPEGLFFGGEIAHLKHFDATLLYRLSENIVKDQTTQTWTLDCIQLRLG